MTLERGHEYAAYIINALHGRRAVRVQRQRAQHRADHQPAAGRLRRGAGAGRQGRLQSRCTSAPCRRSAPLLTKLSARDRGDGRRGRPHRRPDLVYQAICHDPLTAAVLSLAEIRADGQRDVRAEQGLPAAVQDPSRVVGTTVSTADMRYRFITRLAAHGRVNRLVLGSLLQTAGHLRHLGR